MFSDKACSWFVEAWLCYAHICTFLPLSSLPWPKLIGMALNKTMQSPGNVTVSHAETTMCDALMALSNVESTSYLLGFRTTHVKGGSRSSHLFFIFKTTYRGCAWFGWDTQVCIQAIGTRDVSSKWVSKYAFDIEWSSLSTCIKTGTQQVTCSFPVFESDRCIWISDARVRYLFWVNSAPKTALFSLWLATTSFPQTYPIDLTLFPQLSRDQFQLPVWPSPCQQ